MREKMKRKHSALYIINRYAELSLQPTGQEGWMILQILAGYLFSLFLAFLAFVTRQALLLWLMYGSFALVAGLNIRFIYIHIKKLHQTFKRGGIRTITKGRGRTN